MSGYHTVVVGTDGSGPSMRAVEHAAWIAAASDAKLIITTAYVHHGDQAPYHHSEQPRAEDLLKDEGWQVHGERHPRDISWRPRTGRGGGPRTSKCGRSSAARSMGGGLAEEVKADLLVVGNLGMTTTRGRLLGSVPASVTHHAKADVLVVHTRD